MISECLSRTSVVVTGADLGKMVSKIRVTRLDGSPTSLEQRTIRSCVDIGLAILSSISQKVAISNAKQEEHLTAGWLERFDYIAPSFPLWNGLVTTSGFAWVWGEL